MRVYIYIYAPTNSHTHTHTYIYIYTHTHNLDSFILFEYLSIPPFTHLFMCACIYLCAYSCTYLN